MDFFERDHETFERVRKALPMKSQLSGSDVERSLEFIGDDQARDSRERRNPVSQFLDEADYLPAVGSRPPHSEMPHVNNLFCPVNKLNGQFRRSRFHGIRPEDQIPTPAHVIINNGINMVPNSSDPRKGNLLDELAKKTAADSQRLACSVGDAEVF